MAGQYRFKDSNGNIIAQISASVDGVISFSGSQVDFSQANTISLGEVQLAGTASNALLLDGFDSQAFAFTSSIHPFTSSTNSRLNSIETISASNINRLNSLEEKTGSLATTGSNTFFGTQVFSGSVYVKENLIVQGSSSLQNITASAVDIGTNRIILNVDNPSVRYAGISVYDSGSTSGTGSLWWDSLNNHWLYEHPADSGAPYNSAILISGPKNAGNLGEETELVSNFVMKAVGGDHISASAIFDNGSTISLKSNTEITGSTSFTGFTLTNGVVYLGGQNTLQSTDKPHLFRINGGGLGISANNEGEGPQPIYLYTSGTQRLTILGDGKIGIGITNPIGYESSDLVMQLHNSTAGGSATRSMIRLTNSSSGNTFGNGSWVGIDSTLDFYIVNSEVANIQFQTQAVEKMRITSDGKIGIGTTSPNYILDVNHADSYSMARFSTGGSQAQMLLQTSNATGYALYQSKTSGSVHTWQAGAWADGTYRIGQAGVGDYIHISTTGRLGIGTTPWTNFTIGTQAAGTGTSSPVCMSLGSTFGTNAVGSNMKIRLYDAVSAPQFIYGLGISSGLLEITCAQDGQIGFFKNSTSTPTRLGGFSNDGHFTIPSQPYFKYGIDTINLTGTAVRFGTDWGFGVKTTRDSVDSPYFNKANGRFTAPVTGNYLFGVTIMRNDTTGTGPVDFQIVKNQSSPIGQSSGGTYGRGYQQTYSSAYEQVSITVPIRLTAGDYISLDFTGTMSIYEDDSWFYGILLG
jgi:hypothetical protein